MFLNHGALLLVFLAGAAWAGPVLRAQEACETPDAFRPGVSNPAIGFGFASHKEFYRQFSCGDLLAFSPPSRMKAALAQHGAEWMPFCFYHSMNRISAIKHEFALTPINIGEAYQSFAGRDLCSPPQRAKDPLPSQLPSQGRSIRATDSSVKSGPKIANESQKKGQLALFRKIRERITEKCCADGLPGCKESMNQVDVVWCVPDDDPKNPQSCSRMTTYFQFTQEEQNRLRQFFTAYRKKNFWFQLTKDQFLKNFRTSPGRVVLSPYLIDGRFTDKEYTLFHELGHACSYNRRQLMVKQGSLDALQTLEDIFRVYDEKDRPTEGCSLSGQAERAYREIFSKNGASGFTFNCLMQMSRKAPLKRFTKGTCWRGCSRRYLEESFADWMALKTLTPQEVLSQGLHSSCIGTRDDEHPLAADSFRCFLGSPAFYRHVSEATGCRN